MREHEESLSFLMIRTSCSTRGITGATAIGTRVSHETHIRTSHFTSGRPPAIGVTAGCSHAAATRWWFCESFCGCTQMTAWWHRHWARRAGYNRTLTLWLPVGSGIDTGFTAINIRLTGRTRTDDNRLLRTSRTPCAGWRADI